MPYREDLDAFAQQRVRDADEATLFASFQLAERARRRNTLLKLAGGLVVVCAIYSGALAAPRPVRHVSPAVLVSLHHHTPVETATAIARRACARQAMHNYVAFKHDPDAAIAQGDPTGRYSLEDFAKSCPRASNSN